MCRQSMELSTIKNTLCTDKQCREYLAKIRWKDGFVCPRCKGSEAWKTEEVKFKCKKCGYKMSVTADTVLEQTHVPLQKWFMAIWLLTESGEAYTVQKLQEELQIGSNRTALKILQTIRKAQNVLAAEKQQSPNKLIYPDIEISEKRIRFRNQNIPAVIAVERYNGKPRYMFIQQIETRNKEQMVRFLKAHTDPDAIKAGITIVSDSLSQSDLGSEYHFEVPNIQYTFRYTGKVLDTFTTWVAENRLRDSFDVVCTRFCKAYNRKFLPQPRISYEEVLNYILKMPVEK